MLSAWLTDEVRVKSVPLWRNTTPQRLRSQAYVPCEYTVRLCTRGSHWQDLDVPTHRQRTSDNPRASFQLQFTKVPDREEQALDADALDGKSCAARAELPLTCEVVAHDYMRCMQLNAMQGASATVNSHNHVGQ